MMNDEFVYLEWLGIWKKGMDRLSKCPTRKLIK